MRSEYTNRVKILRVTKGINSQRELARHLSSFAGRPISFSLIARMESYDAKNVGWQNVVDIADYFGVTVDYLMGRSDVNLYQEQIKKADDKSQEDNLPPEYEMAVNTFMKKMKDAYINGEFKK